MKGRISTYTILAAALLVSLITAVINVRSGDQAEPAAGNTETLNKTEARAVRFLERGEYPSFASGSMEPGNIRLELSPESFENGRLTVRFYANTHDQTLNEYDLALMTTLMFENLQFKPTHADRMRGHHDSGLMLFDLGKLHDPSSLSTFSITIVGLPSEKIRVFKWE